MPDNTGVLAEKEDALKRRTLSFENVLRKIMQTKIYGTIGPACCDTDTLVRLFEKGMTGVRINLSHSNLKEAEAWLFNIKKAWQVVHAGDCAKDFDKQQKSADEKQVSSSGRDASMQPEILMDLQGPELRIGKLAMPRELQESDKLTLMADGQNNLFDPTEIPVPAMIMPYLLPGQQVLIDDGKLLLEVEELLANNYAECRVIRGGVLKGGKSIALPGTAFYPPTLTGSDIKNIKDAKKYGITGVMLPFVRGKEDLINLKAALKDAEAEEISIFAKIESMDGVNKLSELLPFCDEIVIARGDLGNAMPLWQLPVVQAKIAECCRAAETPFMVVTQMLASMEQAAVPTRAEVSDIFRAIDEGTSSVMLTGETAAGKYPVEAMEYMVNTVREAEAYRCEKEQKLF